MRPARASAGEASAVCTGDVATACECEGFAGDPSSSQPMGTYSVDGNTMSFVEGDAGTPDTYEYCVTGDEMKLNTADSLLVLRRK